MIIFSGWATFAGLLLVALTGSGLEALTGSRAVSYAVAGVALGAFGWWINQQEGQRHRLFWIPIQWWGGAIAVGALAGL